MTVTEQAPAQVQWTAERVNRALWDHFAHQGWHLLFEVTAHRDDFSYADGRRDRRIDVLMIRKARRMGIGLFELLAVEVKVTRGDFLSDVRNPDKQLPWRRVAHRHAYAVPEGLVTPEEVPADSGLLVVGTKQGSSGHVAHPVRFERRAPFTSSPAEFPSWLTSTLIARTSWAEARLKGWSGEHTYNTAGDTVEDLRGKLDAARKEVTRLTTKIDAVTGQRDSWKAAYAAVGGLPCEFCGQQLKPGRPGRGGVFDRWVHVKKADGDVCEIAREKRAQDEAQARWDAMSEAEQATWLDNRGYRSSPDTPESIVRAWSYAAPCRPADSLLPEGITARV